ncbi:MAG: polyamine aminopropyltransferase [Chloroflexi bacterium]|nr:polyamine aminopropyltransferase [Chloroflexota bacterium]
MSPEPPGTNWYKIEDDPGLQIFSTIKERVYSGRTAFQKVEIVDSDLFGRILFLDEDIQSSEKDEFIYHETLVHPGLILSPSPEKVLIIGGGEGATLREVLRDPGVKEAVMVDIDGELVELCKKMLPQWSRGAFDDPRARLFYTDAFKWIKDSDEKFDVIISDLTDPDSDSPSGALFNDDFIRMLKDALTPDGVLVLQASAPSFKARFHDNNIRNIRKVFKNIFIGFIYIPSFLYDWSFIFACKNESKELPGKDEVDRMLERRGIKGLRLYDGETHQRMFSLPKYYRERVKDI